MPPISLFSVIIFFNGGDLYLVNGWRLVIIITTIKKIRTFIIGFSGNQQIITCIKII